MKLTDTKLRELALIAIGFALSGEQAKLEVLGQISPGDLPVDLRDVLEGIKEKQGQPVWKWFDANGAVQSNGNTVIKATLHAIKQNSLDTDKEKLAASLKGACKMYSNVEFVQHIEAAIKEFKEKAGLQ